MIAPPVLLALSPSTLTETRFSSINTCELRILSSSLFERFIVALAFEAERRRLYAAVSDEDFHCLTM